MESSQAVMSSELRELKGRVSAIETGSRPVSEVSTSSTLGASHQQAGNPYSVPFIPKSQRKTICIGGFKAASKEL
eukprot:11154281-Lingulodinium_polyedra.AAC.1